jgi:hypothetical protein
MNTASITPKAIQDLLDELEASKQSRLRAWSVLQRLRMVLSEVGSVVISPPLLATGSVFAADLLTELGQRFRGLYEEQLTLPNLFILLCV